METKISIEEIVFLAGKQYYRVNFSALIDDEEFMDITKQLIQIKDGKVRLTIDKYPE